MLLIDAHVHIYDSFDLAVLFDAAYANFRSQAQQIGIGADFSGLLLLTERSGQEWFTRLADRAGREETGSLTGAWEVRPTGEAESLTLQREDGVRLVVMAGCQMVSSEGLEVLALATPGRFNDGRTALTLLQEIVDAGGIAVLPWAFGKWLGRRRKILEQLFHRKGELGFYLGDNGGRPFIFPYPRYLHAAGMNGEPVLSGTDPLPIAGEEKRVGSFGLYVNETLDTKSPAAQLRALVRKRGIFGRFGQPMATGHFVKNQLALRLGGQS